MTASKLQSVRDRACTRQQWLCHYCGLPMLAPGDPSASKRPHLRCSAEHLLARQDGGTDAADNIVAAHIVCNRRRHKRARPLPPDDYKALVKKRIASGKWHDRAAMKMLKERHPIARTGPATIRA